MDQLKQLIQDYQKYRWFFTASGKLVIGGKSSAQNDELLKKLLNLKENYLIMHTHSPGSPFCIILSQISKLAEKDKEACAVFTGCLSQAWKEGKKLIEVDSFLSSKLIKSSSMKTGTWGVKEKIKTYKIIPQLYLVKQKSKLRAIPEQALKPNQKVFLEISQGKEDKNSLLKKIKQKLKNCSDEEILSALPSGRIRLLFYE